MTESEIKRCGLNYNDSRIEVTYWPCRNEAMIRELRAEVERVYSERNDAVDELVLLRDERAAALAENERLRAVLAKATWLLEGTAEQIDEWFPADKDPTVQSDLRRFAGQWQQDFGLLTAQEALAPHKE